MTVATQRRTLFDALIGEPLELALSQPHQILLSTGSVALMGSFASTSGIVDPLVGYLIAIGVEWAYLRGLASDSRAQTRWGGILNWSAFGIVVLWGVLWCAQKFGVYIEKDGGWLLAAAHVVPVAWLSLCSAQCHRAAMGEVRRIDEGRKAIDEQAAREIEAAAAALDLEMNRKQQELALYEQAQAAKAAREMERERLRAELKMQNADARMKMRRDAHQARANADDRKCPKCGAELDNSRWLAARRWGHCSNCKEAQ